jgi:anti-sigma B factor antagonist
MNLDVIEKEGITVVALNENRLDASIAPAFKQEMENIINLGNKQLILDLKALSFMDSSSLGAMVGILKYLGNDGKMVVVGVTGVVQDLFRLTRMDKVFTLVDDMDTAEGMFLSTV